ncbi:HNH/ENDO VII family nuclease [Pseudogracilibacillus sp. SE30717A]|uniref:HNH/ENDO VII family nuclease n=1 Tax=Pseudogracilibacillus sp. SE30717A TaxID=3098293 RepID=UPI00300DDEC2
MDVKYIPSDWEKTKQGLSEFVGGGHWTLSPFTTANEICNNLDQVESVIRKYDSDGYISFSYDNQKKKYYELNEDFYALHQFVSEVGTIVDDVIDERFYKDMDKFVEAIRDLRIEEYKTTNRIGAMQKINTDFAPSGEIPKAEITLDDLFGGENFYADQIKIEYDQIKEMYPDQEFSLEEYRQIALNTHAFEYNSIKDQQYNKEFWVSIAALVVIVGAALIFPPAGIALGAIYGTLELSTAVTGKDWVSGREVGTGERWFRGLLAPLDLIPAVGSVKKFAILGRAGKLKQAATISLKTSPAVRLKETVEGSIHTARLEGLNRMNHLKDFAKGRAIAVGKKVEKDIIDVGKGIDKGVTVAKQLKESVFPKHQFATPDGAIVSGSKVENTHAVENFFRAKIEDVKGIGKGTDKLNSTKDIYKVSPKDVHQALEGYEQTHKFTAHFRGFEVKAQRSLSHMSDKQLIYSFKKGYSPKDGANDTIVLHHHEQNVEGPLIEMPSRYHDLGNKRQHPFGNSGGVGSGEARIEFNKWRKEYWKARYANEMIKRGIIE